MKSRTLKSPVTWLALVFIVILAFALWPSGEAEPELEQLTLTQFDQALSAGELESIEMLEGPNIIQATRTDGTLFETRYIGRDGNDIANRVLDTVPTVEVEVTRETGADRASGAMCSSRSHRSCCSVASLSGSSCA
jgi:hypothetical protein